MFETPERIGLPNDQAVKPAAVLAATSAVQQAVIEFECRIVMLAADWADCNPGEMDADEAAGLRRIGRAVRGPQHVGGEGTPSIRWGVAAEFGAVACTTTGAAESLIADALDLRHRLPRLWRLVEGAGVRAWKARKVAQATRQLSVAGAAAVDAVVAPVVTSLPWGRCERLLEAAVMTADPIDAELRARAAEAERFVRSGPSHLGLKTLVARAHAGDVIWFMAMVNRIAEILLDDGDVDPVDVRRSKAIGILANPARALQLLADHAQPSRERGTTEQHPDTSDPADPTGGLDAADHLSISVLPPGIDPRRLQPTVNLVVHLAQDALTRSGAGTGVARVEQIGAVVTSQVQRFLGVADCRIRVQPVIDAAGVAAVDRYEVPESMRTALLSRSPADVFPWGVCTNRAMDLDHTIAYRVPGLGGAEGQTRIGNLGPLSRSHHLLKTFGGWHLRQPEPGSYVWRSPHGWHYLVNATGTHDLGNGLLARTLWASLLQASADARERAPAA